MMGRVNFTQIHSENAEVTRLQSHIKTTLNPLLELPISDGVLIKDLSIETSDTRVNHGLGREYEGFVVTRLQANAVIYESDSTNTNKNLFILLKGSSSATADIYFF
jgi:hypothetical protein|tara:strand:- start:506 stop:823 length:318 start_codon:yes stop_codon:yes gene_type:complete